MDICGTGCPNEGTDENTCGGCACDECATGGGSVYGDIECDISDCEHYPKLNKDF